MRSKHYFLVLFAVIIICIIFTSNVRRQAYSLGEYLYKDELVKHPMASLIQRYYVSQHNDYQIHFLDNAIYNFINQGKGKVQDDQIRFRFNNYGKMIPYESETYRPSTISLIEEYDKLLNDLEKIDFSQFKKARNNFDDNTEILDDHIGGLSDTSPPYDDSEVIWTEIAEDIYNQYSAKKGSIITSEGEYKVDVIFSNRYLKLSFDRDWFSSSLIDEIYKGNQMIKSKYFGPQGNLRLIPADLWLLYNDRVFFSIDEKGLRTITSGGLPAKLVIESNEYDLNTVEPLLNESMSNYNCKALIGGSSSILYAIVSKRRVYAFD